MLPTSRVSLNGGDTPFVRSSSARGAGPPPGGRIATDPTPPDDPRLAAFGSLIVAIDRSDVPATIAATRHLRRLGFSVVVTGNPSTRGGRA